MEEKRKLDYQVWKSNKSMNWLIEKEGKKITALHELRGFTILFSPMEMIHIVQKLFSAALISEDRS